jgi:hypothetical protein
MRRLAVVLTVAVLLPVAGGIAARTSTNTVPASLVGRWTRNVTLAELHRHGEYATPAGVWSLVFTRAGAANLFQPGSACFTAGCDETHFPVTVMGASMTLRPAKFACQTGKGTYAWKVSAGTLTLKATADKQCPTRVALLTGVWKKRK